MDLVIAVLVVVVFVVPVLRLTRGGFYLHPRVLASWGPSTPLAEP